jgi:hypothetical protein
MAMTKASMKNKILTKITACNPNMNPQVQAIVDACLEAFCDGIIEEIVQNSTITMGAGDFKVNPGTFKDSLVQPITGQGDNASFALTGKIS